MQMRVICFQWCTAQQSGCVPLLFCASIIIMLLYRFIHLQCLNGEAICQMLLFIFLSYQFMCCTYKKLFSRPFSLAIRLIWYYNIIYLFCSIACISSEVLTYQYAYMFEHVASGYISLWSRCRIYCPEIRALVIKRSLFIQTEGQIARSNTPVSWLKSPTLCENKLPSDSQESFWSAAPLWGFSKNLSDSSHFFKQPVLQSCGWCTFYIMWTNKQATDRRTQADAQLCTKLYQIEFPDWFQSVFHKCLIFKYLKWNFSWTGKFRLFNLKMWQTELQLPATNVRLFQKKMCTLWEKRTVTRTFLWR